MAHDNRPIGVTRGTDPERQFVDLQETVQLLWNTKNDVDSRLKLVEKLLGPVSISRITTALNEMHNAYHPLVAISGQDLVGVDGRPVVIDNRD